MSTRLLLPMAILAAMATGCGWNDAVDTRAATAGLPTPRQLIQEHQWILDRPASSITVDDDNPVTLSVIDDVVSGTGPCNAYRGEISLGEDASVEITDLALTRRDCGGMTMQAEDELVTALETVDTAEVDADDNDRLVLHDGHARLVFRPHDAE